MPDLGLVSGNHCVFRLSFHVIFVTKFRKKWLTPFLPALYSTIARLAEEINIKVGEIKGEADHIHFILKTSPTDTLSSIIGYLKSRSTSLLLNSGVKTPYWGKLKRTIWSSGYFVCSTGGVSLDVLENYIKNQGRA